MTVIEVGGIKEKGEDGNGKLSMSAGEGRGGGGGFGGWGKEPRRAVCEKIPMRDLREMSCLLDWWAMNWRIQLKEEA